MLKEKIIFSEYSQNILVLTRDLGIILIRLVVTFRAIVLSHSMKAN